MWYVVLFYVLVSLTRLAYHLVLLRLDRLDVILTAAVVGLAIYAYRGGSLRSDIRTIVKMLPWYLLVMLILAAYQFYLSHLSVSR